jgi:leader peptidase (prepilin peptidase)/N-methyltransferase
MITATALAGGAVGGMLLGYTLTAVTIRQLAGAMARSDEIPAQEAPDLVRWHRAILMVASGGAAALVLARTGWSIRAVPPVVLLLALIQLAYCDVTRFLLPKGMVHATTGLVALSALVAAGATHEWHRLVVAAIGGVALFALLLAFNLMNPAWMAFGDVRLAPAIGIALAWISPMSLFLGFFAANVLAAVVGVALMTVNRANRKTAVPFGLFLACGAAIAIFAAS